MKTGRTLRILVVGGMISSFRAGAQGYMLDQSFTSPHNEGSDINEGFRYIAQTFTAGLSGSLAGVSVDISSVNNSTLPLYIQIFGVSGGVPDSNVLGDTILSSSSSPLSQMIFFPQAIPIMAGSQYAIVASYVGAPPVGAGQIQGMWEGAGGTTDYYPGGGLYASNDEQLWHSGSGPYYNDQHFQTWVEPVPEPSAWMMGAVAALGVALTIRRRIPDAA